MSSNERFPMQFSPDPHTNDGATQPHVIRVDDYAAQSDAANASPAILAALVAARELKGAPVIIQFSRDRYLCWGGEAMADGRTYRPSIEISGLANVTIDGNGATLVGRDLATLVHIHDSESITVCNFVVDWDPLPHTSGSVTALLADEHAFDLAPMIPIVPAPGRITQAILAYNPDRRRLADNGWEVYQTEGERDATPTTLTDDGRLRVFQRRDTPLPEVGDCVVVRHQVYGYNAFVFSNCGSVTLRDITVHAVPGMAVIGYGCGDISISRIRVVPADQGWMSATADAMHFNACRGTIAVEDSEFAGMGDDAINIHGMYGLATERIDDRTLAVGRARMHPYYDKKRGTWDLPATGDIIEYGGDDEPLIAQGQIRVASARQDAVRERVIVAFDERLPDSVGVNSVLTNISTTPSVRIRRCHMHGNRARGFLMQTRDVVIEDCLFEDISGAGVQICTDGGEWWESLGARDVVVRNCTFRRCNFGVARRAAALDIFSDLQQGRQSAAGVHQRIRLLDNVFEDNQGAAIHVGSSDGVELRGNRIGDSHDHAIIVMNSRNVTIDGDTARGDRSQVGILPRP